MLRIPWAAKQTNISIVNELNEPIKLSIQCERRKLEYFGHIMRREDSRWKRERKISDEVFRHHKSADGTGGWCCEGSTGPGPVALTHWGSTVVRDSDLVMMKRLLACEKNYTDESSLKCTFLK